MLQQPCHILPAALLTFLPVAHVVKLHPVSNVPVKHTYTACHCHCHLHLLSMSGAVQDRIAPLSAKGSAKQLAEWFENMLCKPPEECSSSCYRFQGHVSVADCWARQPCLILGTSRGLHLRSLPFVLLPTQSQGQKVCDAVWEQICKHQVKTHQDSQICLTLTCMHYTLLGLLLKYMLKDVSDAPKAVQPRRLAECSQADYCSSQ